MTEHVKENCILLLLALFIFACVLVLISIEEGFLEYIKTSKMSLININRIGHQEDLPNKMGAFSLLERMFVKTDKFLIDLRKDVDNRCTNSNNPSDKDELTRVSRLVNRLQKNIEVFESEFEQGVSSYTVNKGEELAICVRNKANKNVFHNENTLWFVIMHELAHVMSISEGHNQEFIDNFKYLLVKSKEFGYYEPKNYKEQNINYCGVDVTANPYFFK